MDAVIFCDIKEKKITRLSDKAPSNNIVLYFLSRIQHISTHTHIHMNIHTYTYTLRKFKLLGLIMLP